MSVLSDRQIREYVEKYKMIEPFEPNLIREVEIPPDLTNGESLPKKLKVISYGTSSYGYDLRAGNVFKIFTNLDDYVVDPKNFNPKLLYEKVVQPHEAVIIPPNSFALTVSVEKFRIPRDIITICMGKSTYARCGIIVNVTPFEPGWVGYPTLEISNTTPLPAKIYAYEGLAQVLFLKADEICEVSYADRKGKYQDQENVPIPPKV